MPTSIETARLLAHELGLILSTLRQKSLPLNCTQAAVKMEEALVELKAALEDGAVAAASFPVSEAEAVPKIRTSLVQKELSLQPGAFAPALNQVVKALWPRIGIFVQDLIRDTIEPDINAELPNLVAKGGGVKFTKVSLGDCAPLLGPLLVHHHQESGDIRLHLGVNITSDLHIELTAVGIPIGLKNLRLCGDLEIAFTPPMTKPPFVGGMQVFFSNPPDISIEFGGAARMVDVPGLRGAIRGAVDSAVAAICVLPRRIAVDFDEEDNADIVDLQYPEPIGVLRFTLWSASDLVASDIGLFDSPSSDPYVVASLGIKSWSSPVVYRNLNPQWGGDAGVTADFPLHDDHQVLTLNVWDYDFANPDDLIGVAERVQAKNLVGDGKPRAVDLLKSNGQPGAGSISISTHMLSLTTIRPRKPTVTSRILAQAAKLELELPDIPASSCCFCNKKKPKPYIDLEASESEGEVAPPLDAAQEAFLRGPSEAHLSCKISTIQGLELGSAQPFQVRIKVIRPAGTHSSKDEVCVEAHTQVSHADPKPLAEWYQEIARHLHKEGHLETEIAGILMVGTAEVINFLQQEKDEHAKKKQVKDRREAELRRLHVRQPRFDEIVQMLLPWGAVHEKNIIVFTILDKNRKALAALRMPMSRLLGAEHLELEGPFIMDASGVELIASLRLRWLQSQDVDIAAWHARLGEVHIQGTQASTMVVL